MVLWPVLWAERFKSLLLEGGRAVATVAAYIVLNPVRAAPVCRPQGVSLLRLCRGAGRRLRGRSGEAQDHSGFARDHLLGGTAYRVSQASVSEGRSRH